jgi:hypothetical protein
MMCDGHGQQFGKKDYKIAGWKKQDQTNVGALSGWVPGPAKVMRRLRIRTALRVHPSPRFLKLHRFAG